MSLKPIYPAKGYDAAGADAYTDLIAATAREYHNLSVYCATKHAIVSLDGGTTENIFLVAGAPPTVLHGISIPKGAAIQAKNETAGQNYATLALTVW